MSSSVPSSASSSSAIHVRACTPFVTEPIGTLVDRRARARAPCHISRDTSPCSAETPFACDDVRSANGVRPKPVVAGVDAAERDELVPARSRSARRAAPTFRSTSAASKSSLPAGTGVCVVKTVDARSRCQRVVARELLVLDELAQPLELEERRVALVHVEDRRLEAERAQRAHAADAEHELLAEPVRAGRRRRARSVIVARPVRVAVDVGVEEVERHAPDLRAPDLRAHGDERAVVVRDLDRRRDRALELERQARAGRSPGSARPASRSRRAAGGSSPRGRRARRRRAARRDRTRTSGGRRRARRGRPSRSAGSRRARTRTRSRRRGSASSSSRRCHQVRRSRSASSSASTRSSARRTPASRAAASSSSVELGEERGRVVVERGEALAVELLEERARAGQPAEPEVARDLAQRGAQRGRAVDDVSWRSKS